MSKLLPVTIDGETFYIEAAISGGVEPTTSAQQVAEQVHTAFERARHVISGVAGELVGAVKAMDSMLTPDEFTFEFGITFTANGNIVLASASTETTLHITMTYHHGKEKGT